MFFTPYLLSLSKMAKISSAFFALEGCAVKKLLRVAHAVCDRDALTSRNMVSCALTGRTRPEHLCRCKCMGCERGRCPFARTILTQIMKHSRRTGPTDTSIGHAVQLFFELPSLAAFSILGSRRCTPFHYTRRCSERGRVVLDMQRDLRRSRAVRCPPFQCLKVFDSLPTRSDASAPP